MLRIVSIGKGKDAFLPAVEDYVRRISRHVRAEIEDVPPGRSREAVALRDEEGRALLRKVRDGDALIALDPAGEEDTSEGFARWLGTALARARGDLVFAIGGAEGLSAEVIGRAARKLSLSRLTLAHRLARVVLAEQLYRALSILKNEPYHRGQR